MTTTQPATVDQVDVHTLARSTPEQLDHAIARGATAALLGDTAPGLDEIAAVELRLADDRTLSPAQVHEARLVEADGEVLAARRHLADLERRLDAGEDVPARDLGNATAAIEGARLAAPARQRKLRAIVAAERTRALAAVGHEVAALTLPDVVDAVTRAASALVEAVDALDAWDGEVIDARTRVYGLKPSRDDPSGVRLDDSGELLTPNGPVRTVGRSYAGTAWEQLTAGLFEDVRRYRDALARGSGEPEPVGGELAHQLTAHLRPEVQQ